MVPRKSGCHYLIAHKLAIWWSWFLARRPMLTSAEMHTVFSQRVHRLKATAEKQRLKKKEAHLSRLNSFLRT